MQAWNSTSPQLRTRFWYGPDRSCYQRMDDGQGISPKRTLTIGNLEIVSQGGITTTKRYVAGILVQDVTGSATTSQFLFHDHIGSVVRAVSASGVVIEGMDYGAFGERRGYTDPTLAALVPRTTPRGFTGHEMIDGTDIVHMNGRIYDSALGRFLQADPIIQEPNNPQNFNRYSYVLNNPLSLTDPSGFSFLGKLGKFIRPLAAIAISIYLPGSVAFFGAAVAGGATLASTVVAGFLAGVVASGTLKGGLVGAFSAAAFFGVGSAFKGLENTGDFAGTSFSQGAFGAKVLAHGITGGVMSELQGGQFGHGFAAAGVTQAFSGKIDGIDPGTAGISAERVFVAAALGGTTSALTGGKFANGAITGAFSRAFNDELLAHQNDDIVRFIAEGEFATVIDELGIKAEFNFDDGLTLGAIGRSPNFTAEIDANGKIEIENSSGFGVDLKSRALTFKRLVARGVPVKLEVSFGKSGLVHYKVMGVLGLRGASSLAAGIEGSFNPIEAITRPILNMPITKRIIERKERISNGACRMGLASQCE